MKKYVVVVAGAILSVLLLAGVPIQAKIKAGDITGGVKAPHVNIAAFHTLHGQEGFRFPEHISDQDILGGLKGKAQYIFMNHTAGLKDGDVITISNDVLRDAAGKFADFGVDCQLSIRINGENTVLSGMCEFLMIDQDYREIEHKGMIKPVAMQPGKDWLLVYFDAEDGIAIYADEDLGAE